MIFFWGVGGSVQPAEEWSVNGNEIQLQALLRPVLGAVQDGSHMPKVESKPVAIGCPRA